MDSNNINRHPCEMLYDAIMTDNQATTLASKLSRFTSEGRAYAGSGVYEIYLALLWMEENHREQAVAVLLHGLAATNEYHPNLHWALMQVRIGQGEFAQAVQHGVEAASHLQEPSIYLGLTIAYHCLQLHAEAAAAMRQAMKFGTEVACRGIGINQGIYSLVHLNLYEEAQQLIDVRKGVDPAWANDEMFSRAGDYLRTHRQTRKSSAVS